MKFSKKIFQLLVLLCMCTYMKGQEVAFLPDVVQIKIEREKEETISKQLRNGMLRSGSGMQFIQVGEAGWDKVFRQAKAYEMKRMIPYNARFDARHRAAELDLWYEVKIDSTANVLEVVEELKKQQGVKIAEPSYLIEGNATVSDEYPVDDTDIKKQWNLHNTGLHTAGFPDGTRGIDINAFKAWEINSGRSNVVVAIVDGAFDLNHIDLRDNVWVNTAELNGTPGVDDDGNGYVDDIHGYNFVDFIPTTRPSNHGTHVAGIVGAKANNAIGIAGVAGGGLNGDDGARLMTCQILNPDGSSGSSEPAMALVYAADNGAVIAQCSWGYQIAHYLNQSVLDAIDYFIENAGRDESGNPLPNTPMVGGLAVFAAGNINSEDLFYPASYEKCFSVAAVNNRGEKASYSTHGKWVSITAPGGAEDAGNIPFALIHSTFPNNTYGPLAGTSMACPHVSGVAALILSEYGNENYTPEMLKHRILASANDVIYTNHNAAYQGKLGAGLLDAFGALDKNLPDVEANLYYGTFPWSKDGVKQVEKQNLRILNSGDGVMELAEIRTSNPIFTIPDFVSGQTLQAGEFIDLDVLCAPTAGGEIRDTLQITFGGAFSGQVSTTFLLANVVVPEHRSEVVLFSDDFENGLYRWSIYDQDGDTRAWIPRTNSAETNNIHALSGFNFAASEVPVLNSTGHRTSPPKNWLISPVFDLSEFSTEDDVQFSYWIKSPFQVRNSTQNTCKVLISTNPEETFNPESFDELLLEEVLSWSVINGGFNLRSLPLSQYAGKKVQIAFVHEAPEANSLVVLENVKLSFIPKEDMVDVAISDVIVANNRELTSRVASPVRVLVRNNGTEVAQNVEVSYQLNDGQRVEEIIPSITAGQTISYQFDESLSPENAEYDAILKVKVNIENDKVAQNNVYDKQLWINPFNTVKSWDLEDAKMPEGVVHLRFDNYFVSNNLRNTSFETGWLNGQERFLIGSINRMPDPILGNLILVSSSYFSAANAMADRWICIPVDAIETDSLLLKWTTFSFDQIMKEDYEVWATTTTVTRDSKPEDFELIASVNQENSTVTHHAADLTKYANAPFTFAFRHRTMNGCILALDNIKLLASGGVSALENIQVSNPVFVYPNPVKDHFTVQAEYPFSKIEVLDLTGKIIYSSGSIQTSTVTVANENWATGYYLLRVYSSVGILTSKICITY